jgi:hypothetical protein
MRNWPTIPSAKTSFSKRKLKRSEEVKKRPKDAKKITSAAAAKNFSLRGIEAKILRSFRRCIMLEQK